MRMIDADALTEKCGDWYVEEGTEEGFIGTVKQLIDAQPERKKPPVFKSGETLAHVSYANGSGGFESHKWADWVCPDCGWFVGEQYVPRRRNQRKANYCSKCGCGIDWLSVDAERKKNEIHSSI